MRIFANIDCMVGMKEYPDNYFELAVVDPPYQIADNPNRHGGSGAGKLRNRFLNQNAKKFKSWDVKPDKNYFDELFRVSRNQIILGGNYFDLPPTRGIAVWDKEQPFQNFSAFEYAWTSFHKPAKIFRLAVTRTGEKKIHPTQKPVKLYKWILTQYANSGDKILDTHVGSASSLIACEETGFEYVGFELDKDYFEAAKKRLKEVRSQLRLAL